MYIGVCGRKEKETRFRACVSVTGWLARVSVDGKERAGPKHCASLRDNERSVGHPNASGGHSRSATYIVKNHKRIL
jgi:hypothetical protein